MRIAGCEVRVAGCEVRVAGCGTSHEDWKLRRSEPLVAYYRHRAWRLAQDDLNPEYLTSVLCLRVFGCESKPIDYFH